MSEGDAAPAAAAPAAAPSQPKSAAEEALDDFLEGCAALYKNAIWLGGSIGSCVKETAYPIKEAFIQSSDATAAQNDPAHARAAADRTMLSNQNVPTFQA